MDNMFKLNGDTHKILFNLRPGLKKTLTVSDTCVVPSLGNFIANVCSLWFSHNKSFGYYMIRSSTIENPWIRTNREWNCSEKINFEKTDSTCSKRIQLIDVPREIQVTNIPCLFKTTIHKTIKSFWISGEGVCLLITPCFPPRFDEKNSKSNQKNYTTNSWPRSNTTKTLRVDTPIW